MHKRFIPLVILAGLVFLVAAACGSDSAPTPTPAARSSPPTIPQAPTGTVSETATATPSTDVDGPGMQVATEKGCLGCHTTDGSPLVGPSWGGSFGTTRNFEGGGSVTIDEAFLRESMKKPGARIAAGFSNIMPTLDLSESDVDALVAYIVSLQ